MFLPACMSVLRVLDLGVLDSCELPCICWELNLDPVEVCVLLSVEISPVLKKKPTYFKY